MTRLLIWAVLALATALAHATSGATHVTGWLILTTVAAVGFWRAWRDLEQAAATEGNTTP